jgi:mannose-6-phosphate isomerase-like protein (cupin superfamily)
LFLTPDDGERLSVVGDRIRVLAEAATTGGRCSIFESRSAPGVSPPLHRHGIDDEFFYVIEGTYKFVCDGRTVIATPGCFVAAPRGSTHSFCNIGDTDGRMLIVTTPGGLEGPFRETHAATQHLPPDPLVLGAIFAKFDLEFLGPPLKRD